jgi:hypothetical protein
LSNEPPWVGKAQTGVARRAFGQRGGEDAGGYVVVVVNLGGGLARKRSEDAAGVLHQSALEGDWGGEEERVQRWAVEAFADVGAGGDSEQWWPVRSRLEPFEGGRPGLGTHAATQHDRLVSPLHQRGDEAVEMFGPLGEHQAVPAASQGGRDVIHDLAGSDLVGDQVAIDGGDAAGCGRVGVAVVPVRGGGERAALVEARRRWRS